MENPGLTISPCEVLNPATLLPIPEGSLPFHSCLETLDHWTKPPKGLSEDPLTNPEEIWYTDGRNFLLDGKGRAGHTVVSNFETIEAIALPSGRQATTCSASPTRIYKTTANHGKYHSHLDGHCYKDSEAWYYRRGRPNAPCCPSSAGCSQKDFDVPIPKELGLPSLEGGMLGS